MKPSKNTPAGQLPIAYSVWSVVVIVGSIVGATGLSVADFEPIAGIRRGRLVAGLARPSRLTMNDVFRVVRAADVDWIDFWQQVADGARIVAAQVRDGVACHLCGRAFIVGSLSRPDGFGEHGQLFRCSDTWGCSADDHRDDEPVMVPRTGDRFAIRTELADGSTGYEPVTVISVGANVLVDGVEDTESVALFELEPIELADRPPVDGATIVARAIEQDRPASEVVLDEVLAEDSNPFSHALGYVAEIRKQAGEPVGKGGRPWLDAALDAEEAAEVREGLRCIYCGRDLVGVGTDPVVVGHDDQTGHVDRACGDGFGCNDAAPVKADQ